MASDTLNGRLAKLEKDASSNPNITPEKGKYLEDTVLDLQCRSMKNNLIFYSSPSIKKIVSN
jgi:hypothetical protein